MLLATGRSRAGVSGQWQGPHGAGNVEWFSFQELHVVLQLNQSSKLHQLLLQIEESDFLTRHDWESLAVLSVRNSYAFGQIAFVENGKETLMNRLSTLWSTRSVHFCINFIFLKRWDQPTSTSFYSLLVTILLGLL